MALGTIGSRDDEIYESPKGSDDTEDLWESEHGVLVITEAERKRMAVFLGTSVTARTLQRHKSGWQAWLAYIISLPGGTDPYLRGVKEEDEKAFWLAAFFKARYETGLRGKDATAAGASVRIYFEMALLSTAFCDSSITKRARRACRMSPDELRACQSNGRKGQAKLPVWEGLMEDLRTFLWEDKEWGWTTVNGKMIYMCLMWGYDLAVRVSECTAAEKGAQDHNIRACQVVFRLRNAVTEDGTLVHSVRGGSRASRSLIASNVICCEVEASSHKVGDLSKKKMKVIGRRSESENQWCDDMVEWITRSGVKAQDPLFCRYATKQGYRETRLQCTAKMAREALKAGVVRAGLDPNLFSFHSLRKGGLTHMSAKGVPKDQALDRGNYAAGSVIMNTTYDYNASGLGPLAANSLSGGRGPGLDEVRRWIPARHENVIAEDSH